MSRHVSPSDTLAAPRAVPKTMRAAVIERFGGPEVLVLREVAVPQPGPEDILVKLHTAGVGEWDAWHREGGDAPEHPRFPLVLGTDGAGVVAARGSRVQRHLAVQFARLRGAKVLGIASGDDGVALVQRLGAEASVDGKKADWAAAVRRFAPHGLDKLLALIGGPSLEDLLAAMRRGARVAWPNGIEPEPGRRPGIEFLSYDATPGTDEFARLTRAVEAAQLKVHISAAFPLAAAAKAHERLAAGHVLGKIVLRA